MPSNAHRQLVPAVGEPQGTYHLLEPRDYPRLLSLVIPMYNEESGVAYLRGEMVKFLSAVSCEVEVVLVNDGSKDATLSKIADWAAEDPRIKVIHLSRNFGHQLAATAGLDYAGGDAVVLLDADLQDPLHVVHRMIEKYREGYDVVYGQRAKRPGETMFKGFTAWAFYRLMRRFVYKDLPVDTGDFRLISRQCLLGLRRMKETHRFLRGMVAWVGYPQCAVVYDREPRQFGETKYTLLKMLQFAWTAATAFSSLPLRASLLFGWFIALVSLEEAVRALSARALGWYVVPGWRSLMIVMGVLGGAILVSIGILGEYVAKIFEQAKDRPLYLVARTFNCGTTAPDNGATRAE